MCACIVYCSQVIPTHVLCVHIVVITYMNNCYQSFLDSNRNAPLASPWTINIHVSQINEAKKSWMMCTCMHVLSRWWLEPLPLCYDHISITIYTYTRTPHTITPTPSHNYTYPSHYFTYPSHYYNYPSHYYTYPNLIEKRDKLYLTQYKTSIFNLSMAPKGLPHILNTRRGLAHIQSTCKGSCTHPKYM